ncbi:LPS 1,2-glucosyltransferase [Synergistales bacterium]|nr:LPS 1,2-glucosyltransferase [Synergistales bacterium]
MDSAADIIHVVLAVYDPKGTYSRHAGIVMTSIFERTKSPVCVHILHDETLTEDNRARFRRTARVFGQEVNFIDVSEAILKMGSDVDKFAGIFSRGAFFRLLIPDIMDIAKVIYLDCDIAVNLDIAELWDTQIDDFCLAVILDLPMIDLNRKMHDRIRTWAMRLGDAKYFNSGVLLMNLDRIRQKKYNLAEEARSFFERYHHCADCPDQDFLNSLFMGETLYADGRFNRTVEYSAIESSILHFAGKPKPWIPHAWKPRDYFYWETLARSEWRDQLVGIILEIYEHGEEIHSHTADCWRHIARRLKRDIFTNNSLVKLFRESFKELRIVLTELIYRLRSRS